MNAFLHHRTPVLLAVDGRNAAVRTVIYHRTEEDQASSSRITSQRFDARGFVVEQWDPRLSSLAATNASVMANQQTRFSLSGRELRSDSVDAGWRVSLFNAATQAVTLWDGRETRIRSDYDDQLRPVALFETVSDGASERCVERFTYAANTTEDAQRNRCSRVLRHDDPAGSLWHETFAVTGQPGIETRRFCLSLTTPDWPNTSLDTQSYSTRWRYDALGAVMAHTDAVGHVRTFSVDIAGRPRASQLDGLDLLKRCEYNAFDQVEVEQAGNDVLTITRYSPATGWLQRLQANTLAGHLLQDLHYQYDPVGNVEQIEDLAQPVQWFAQQRVEALSTYRYDTLYQLVEATGRESINQMIGPDLPGLETFGMPDDSRWRNYTQTYTYDSGNNLTQLKHDAGAGHTYLRQMVVDAHSNRSLLKEENPADFTTRFDANGNHLALAPGQLMHWNARNQLHQVTQVVRAQPDGQDNDLETYLYDGEGQRVRKVRRAKTGGGEQISQTLYLPGLEVRESTSGERLNVMTTQAGRNNVQVLHWEAGRPDEIDQDQWRYSLADHLGSSTLELDQTGELISQESYYPYGGTSWWAARNAVQARYKTVRYSGKERDATGLYYYGLRYYAPWLSRWINPDPAGNIDGLNLYRMVRNNPTSLSDLEGLAPKKLSDKKQQFVGSAGVKLAHLISESGEEANKHKDTIRGFMEREHASIKVKRFDQLWPLVVNEAKNNTPPVTLSEKASISVNRTLELGRGGDAVTYDQENGYIIKEFHKPIIDLAQQKREVDMFNHVYGAGAASILSNTMIKMKKIKGVAISDIGVGSFREREGNALIDSLKLLHSKNIYHGDLHYGNILYDKESGEFSMIDFGTSKVETDQQVLQEEMEDFKTNFVYRWPGYTRPAASVVGTNGRVYI